MHDTLMRRADLDPPQLVLGRDPPLGQFRGLGAVLGQILADFRAQILIDLDDAELGLGNFAAVLRDLGKQDAVVALKARRLALLGGQPPELDQVLLPKLACALQLLLDPLDLFVLGRQLLLGAPDLLVEFRDLRAQ